MLKGQSVFNGQLAIHEALHEFITNNHQSRTR